VATAATVRDQSRWPRNAIGGDGIQFWGQSFVANTSGQIIAKAGLEKEQILIQEIDLATVDMTGTQWPVMSTVARSIPG